MGRKFTILLCFTLYSRANSKYKPPRELMFGGGWALRFNGRFFVLQFLGAFIWRGLFMEGLIFRFLQYVI